MVLRELVTAALLDMKLASLKGAKGPIYLLFTAEKDDSGRRWCPDCRNAEPVLEEAFLSLPASATILEIPLSRESWKGPTGPKHPFRSPPYNVKGIPTLCLWDAVDQKVLKKFTESECEQLESLTELMSSHYRTARGEVYELYNFVQDSNFN